MARKKKYNKKKGTLKVAALPSYAIVCVCVLLLVFFGTLSLLAQAVSLNDTVFQTAQEEREQQRQQFIQSISGHAQYIQSEYGILPSISIAQAILESDWGTSKLATEGFNLYGIKGGSGESMVMTTAEFVNGEWIEIEASFRTYGSWEESMEDHARLLAGGTTWNAAQYAAVLQAANYEEAAYALQSGGYATDPDYPEKLIRLIEQYSLYQYD